MALAVFPARPLENPLDVREVFAVGVGHGVLGAGRRRQVGPERDLAPAPPGFLRGDAGDERRKLLDRWRPRSRLDRPGAQVAERRIARPGGLLLARDVAGEPPHREVGAVGRLVRGVVRLDQGDPQPGGRAGDGVDDALRNRPVAPPGTTHVTSQTRS